jgi:hypothetical protein
LILRTALGAGAAKKAIRQEHLVVRAIGLLDVAFAHVPSVPIPCVDLFGQTTILVGVRRVIVIEAHEEGVEVRGMGFVHAPHELFGADALITSPDHDRRAVRIVRADKHTVVAYETLEASPDVRLDVFDQMPQVNVSIRIGQGRRHENAAH